MSSFPFLGSYLSIVESYITPRTDSDGTAHIIVYMAELTVGNKKVENNSYTGRLWFTLSSPYGVSRQRHCPYIC